MKRIYLFFVFNLAISASFGQTWFYDFGTGTGTANNSNAGSGLTTFFTNTVSPTTPTPIGGGIYRVRIGSNGGTIMATNPGSSLGTFTELEINAATGTSTNKFGVYDWVSPTSVGYFKSKIRFTSSGNGTLNISFGLNTIANDNQGFTSHYNNSLVSLRVNFSGGGITTIQRRTSGFDNSIATPGLLKDADQIFEIYANNSSIATSYTRSGSNTLNPQSWDIWVDGIKISPSGGWAKAGNLPADVNLSGFAFFGESSTANAAYVYLDDLEYSNFLPSCISQSISGLLLTETKTYGDANYTLNATASSGLNVAYSSSNTAVATISGNTVTIVGAGTTIITASQAGDGTYCPAMNATQTLTVNPKTLTLSGLTANNKIFDGTTTATLSGTPALVGLLAGDVGNVSLGGAPVANFASATVGGPYAVTVSGYTISGTKSAHYSVNQPTGLTASITAAANSISLSPATQTRGPYCNVTASGIALSYTITGTVTAPFLELSNSSGSFASGTTNLVSMITGTGPYTITGDIPAGHAGGTLYRIRIKSTDATPVVSLNNGSDITIYAQPAALAPNGGGASAVCIGSSTPAFTNGSTIGNWSIANTAVASVTPGGIVTGMTGGSTDVIYQVTNGTCSTSVASPLVVNPLPANPTGTISGITPACTSTSLLYSAPTSGIYWQTVSNGTDLSKPTTSNLSVTTSGNYYARAFNGNCWSSGQAGPYAVVINTAIVIGTSPTNQIVTSPAATTFSVSGISGTVGGYQWQVNTGSGFVDVSTGTGSTTATYTTGSTTTAMTGYLFRCIVKGTNPCGDINSNQASLTVNGSTSTDYYRSVVNNGLWNNPASWQSSPNGISGWITASLAPDAAASGILIRNTFNIDINGTITADDITIETGATLTVNGGVFTLNNGVAATDMQVNGTFTYSGGNFIQNASSGITFSALSIYNHSAPSAILTLPIATWNVTSTCNVTGLTNSGAISGNSTMAQTFGNFSYSNAAQSNYLNVQNSAFNVAGTLTVGPSIQSQLSFGNDGGIYSNTINTLVVSGGILNATGSATENLTVTNGVSVTGGTFAVSGGNGGGTVNIGTDLSISGGGYVVVLNNSSSQSSIVNITRDLLISGNNSQINLESASSAGSATVNVGRDFTCSANSSTVVAVDFGSGAVTGNVINIKRNFTNTGTSGFQTTSPSASTGFSLNGGGVAQSFNYTGATSNWTQYIIQPGSKVVMASNLTLGSSSGPASTFNVSSSATLDFATYSIIAGGVTNPQFLTSAGSNLVSSNINGIGGTSATGSLQNFGSININATSGRAQLATGVNYTFNGATTTPFPASGTFGDPADITLGANVTLNRPAFATGTVVLNTFDVTLNTNDLYFSTITGSGSVLGDNTALIKVSGVVGATAGTLRFKTGSEILGRLTMERTGRTLVLGSKLILDGAINPTNNGRMVLTDGLIDASGQILSFINGNTPVSRGNGMLKVNASSGLVFGTTSNLGGTTFTLPDAMFTTNPAIATLAINRTNPLQLNAQGMELSSSLNLTTGVLRIGSSHLNLNGASLSAPGGYLEGSNTSDFTVTGTTGGIVTIPLPANTSISLRTVTIGGSRTLAMDGVNNINLSGPMTIAAGATYDNGGESAINSSGGSISISGRFLTRDVQGFVGTNTAIPSIVPILNAACTVEYGLAGDQAVQGGTAPMYFNINLSNSGIKTLASSNSIDVGTVTISGSAIFNTRTSTFGTSNTKLVMTGTSKLLTGGGGTKPDMGSNYTLGVGTTIQFDSASATVIRLTAPSSSSFVQYYNLIVNGSNMTTSSAISGLAFQTGGSFTVKNGAIFKVATDAGFTGGNSTAVTNTNSPTVILENGSTIDYFSANNQPITNTIPYQHLILSGTGIKTAPAGTLTVQGNFTKTGTSSFAHNNGKVLLNGAAQSFSGLPYCQLELSGGIKTTSGGSISCSIDSVLKINSGANLTISANDSVTIKSTATRTASVAEITGPTPITYAGTGAGMGKFVIERYLLSGRKWRLLSVPTTRAGQSIRNSWQENGLYVPNYGFKAADVRSDWAARGYDQLGFNTSVKVFGAPDSWYALDFTNTSNMNSREGYMVFVAGDRNITSTGSSATTFRTSGSIKTGGSIANITADQYTVVANPYPSRIDLRNLAFSGSVTRAVAVWDPSLTGSYGLGAWNYIYEDAGVWKVFSNSSIYGPKDGAVNFIESGMAFMVRAFGSAGTVGFSETAKVVGSHVSTFTSGAAQQLRIDLNYLAPGGEPVALDGAFTDFDQKYDHGIDIHDIHKMNNWGEQIAFKTGDSLLAIQRRGSLVDQDTLFLQMARLKIQAYQFEIRGENLDYPGRTGFLVDQYLNTMKPFALDGSSLVNFTVENVPGSYAPDRFYMVFRQAAAGPLPVNFTSIKAVRNTDQTIAVMWKVGNEAGITDYEIQRSSDGIQFRGIGVARPAGNSGRADYLHLDAQPLPADNFYRIRASSISGLEQYSSIVKVSAVNGRSAISLFPNPVKDGQLHLQFTGQRAGNYQLNLFNSAGQVVYSGLVTVTGAVQSEILALPAGLPAGSYQLRVTGTGRQLVIPVQVVD